MGSILRPVHITKPAIMCLGSHLCFSPDALQGSESSVISQLSETRKSTSIQYFAKMNLWPLDSYFVNNRIEIMALCKQEVQWSWRDGKLR